MDTKLGNTELKVFPSESTEYNPYSTTVNSVGEFKDIKLNNEYHEDPEENKNKGNIYPEFIEMSLSGSDPPLLKDPSGESSLKHIGAEMNFGKDNMHLTKQHKLIIAIAFSLTFLSNFVGHFIREPLFTTKVNIQSSFGSTTLQLEYLDISYIFWYSIGQFLTPIAFPRDHVAMFVSMFHFLMGVTHFMMFIWENLPGFVFGYGLTGFACAFLWLAMYTDLHSWLPIKYRLIMITMWCTSSELGLIFGTIMCAKIQTDKIWKVLFLITSFSNFASSFLLYACYIKPKRNAEDSEFLKEYIPRDKLFDPVNISKENTKMILEGLKKVYSQGPEQLELETLPTTNLEILQSQEGANYAKIVPRIAKTLVKKIKSFFKKIGKAFVKAFREHIDVMKRVKYLNIYTVALMFLRSTRNCFAFWISFYLTTVVKYSIKNGIYATLIFQLGSVIGSLISGTLSKIFLKNYHLTSATISSLSSLIAIASIYFIDMKKIVIAFSYVFIVGLCTNCTEMIMTTRGLKALSELSLSKKIKLMKILDEEQRDYSLSLGTMFSIATFLSLFQGYIAIFIAHHLGWKFAFLYCTMMLLCSTGALSIPARNEINRLTS